MSNFRTKINIVKSEKKISYNSKLIFIGSCFAENIGNKLIENKFDTIINPFGINYNPATVSNTINYILEKKLFDESMLGFYNNLWYSFAHHSKFSDTSKKQCLDKINTKIILSHNQLKEADFLFITFGTSIVYKLNADNSIIANCHKIPAKNFSREMLSATQIIDSYAKLLSKIKKINPNLHIVLTISPIRHWKDGAFRNNISKSVLFLIVNELIEKHNQITYFPAYEILLDELRDYRFYADDMLHPSNVAINYIWEKFRDAYFDADTVVVANKITQIIKAFNHKIINNNNKQQQFFASQNIMAINCLKKQYNKLNFKTELKYFEKLQEKS